MRQLTILGFLSEYVKSLSKCNSLNIHKLINEVYGGNYRLREPFFLYCFIRFPGVLPKRGSV